MENLDLSQHICYSFYQVNRLFNQFYTKNLQEFDLTYTQYLSLVILWKTSPITLINLGKELELSSNTLTPLLKRLENKGYIHRYKSKNDKRQLYIKLTQQGKELENILRSKLFACFKEIENLNPESTKSFVKSNKELAITIKKYLDNTEV
ncbi:MULTISPECIES: MarR family winged helix-turn-helix transcriptional regulator [unclassified Gemella]|uniref:MarR family winged helix-turn-helix transcriptional regulator n=1 Tax=unclassified Gemella TaxID=2624949 RepID=UPI0010730420|nr:MULTISPECIES: MarR family transcriptional regulator [unclassified Gemella]MBF0710452.1 MarR family transcriptional regulator [Gemella sp. GL1.1]MBF0747352.1 MarR family transcriptional regulator [Gemella sp. 19428wG2_WT2a]NYS27796.1 MarR family transcriptional regulator [Gemella sp. GL1]TFU57510.1 MarR family transcriptional regulator [Gemella sp. WT2a]